MSFANYPSLARKSVIVTGGAQGIGRDIVLGFARNGARVGFIDIDAKHAQALVDSDPSIHFAHADLRDIGALQSAIATLRAEIGAVDILVNNAARDDRHDWREVTQENFDEIIHTNFRHHFFAIQALAPDMIAKGAGSIINMGSNSWWSKASDLSVYGSTKAAIHGLTRTMARELGRDRVRVNVVVPGWIDTERQREKWMTREKIRDHIAQQVLPDLVTPVDVANMVLFLASDDAKGISAQSFFVDGGVV